MEAIARTSAGDPARRELLAAFRIAEVPRRPGVVPSEIRLPSNRSHNGLFGGSSASTFASAPLVDRTMKISSKLPPLLFDFCLKLFEHAGIEHRVIQGFHDLGLRLCTAQRDEPDETEPYHIRRVIEILLAYCENAPLLKEISMYEAISTAVKTKNDVEHLLAMSRVSAVQKRAPLSDSATQL